MTYLANDTIQSILPSPTSVLSSLFSVGERPS
jgi:hypothetical protein